MKEIKTNDGKRGGLLKGKPHYDKNGNSLGGIKAIVTDANGKPVELEGGEVIINKEASKIHWKQLSKINQSAGNGVAIGPPLGADEDPEEYKDGGRIIEFNPNHIPNKWVVQYAQKIKKENPEIWKLGGNIFGNEAFENLLRVSKRGHWLDSEEWMYIKWRSYVARHKQDFRIEGVVAMLKWCDKVDKGWAYMKDLIEENIEKIKSKSETTKTAKTAKTKMQQGGNVEDLTKLRNLENYVLSNLDEIKSNRKTYGFIRISKITNPYDLSTLLGVDSRIFKNADIPYYAEFIADLLKSGKKMAEGGEVKQPSIEEISGVLLNHLKRYSKEVYGEDIDDDSFMIKTTKEGEHYQAEELSATTKSGQNIHITVEELYMERGGEVENNSFPEKIIGLDEIVWLKTKENKQIVNYTPFYRGHNINVGGFNVGSRRELNNLISDYGLSIQLYNKLKYEPVKELPKFNKGGELSKGIKAEKEHQKTIDKIYNRKVPKSKAPELIAKDHLKEDKKYYSKLEKMEGKKFANGGGVNEYEIGTEGVWGGRGNPRIKVTKITPKTISYIDFSDNKSKFDTKEKFDRLFKPDNSSINLTTPTTPSTTTAKTKPAPPTIKTTKISDLENLSERIDKLEPSYIPSTDPSTWNAEYKVGDVVRVRVDMEKNYVQNKPSGSPIKYADTDNSYQITKIKTIGAATRKQNPSGKLYVLNNDIGGTWEGKDLELAFEIDKKQPQQPQKTQQPQQQIKKPQKQVKTIEPEPIKRQFDSSKDYAEVFKNYFEKDMPSSRIVTEENKRRSIVENFILSSKDIAGFNEEKLQKIHSYIKGE
jgi:hypothetical protein